MKRRNWALIAGAIRSDFYLRVIIVKLCSLRDKGLIEGIVLSTWENEIDTYPGLRDELKRCGIVLVETPYIDEEAENKFNQLIYARQNMSIDRGLSVIPDDCFVIKLRTDFLAGFQKFLDYIFDEKFDDTIKTYGTFPRFYKNKMTLESYHANHIMHGNDRFFYGQKQDLKKISTPIQHRKFARFIRLAENELLFSYAFQNIPLLREIWNILNCGFFDCLISYCQSKKDEDLKLPIIVYRIYALVTVFSYTHVTFSCNNLCNEYDFSKPIELVKLFQNRIRNGFDIEKIVMGHLKPTNASKLFVEELRKISIGLPETETYTFEEYKELCDFAANELLNSKLVADYPFAKENGLNTTKTESIKILFSKYQNQEVVDELLFRIDSSDSVLSLVNEKILDDSSELGLSILKSVIFDRTAYNNFYYKVIYKYINRVENCIDIYDDYTWSQVKRNMCFAFNEIKLNEYALASMYLFFKTSSMLLKNNKSVLDLYYDTLRLFQARMYGKITGFKFEYDLTQHERFVENMILFLHERAVNDEMSENEIEMIKALLLIAPEKCPFSRAVLDKIQKNNLQEIRSNIISLYGDDECNIDNYIVSGCVLRAKKSLMSEPFEQEKFVTTLGGAENIKKLGTKSSEYVLKILLLNDAVLPELIETLFNNANMKDSILYKAYHCDTQQIFDDSNICLSNSDYLLLCTILKNNGSIEKYTEYLENATITIMQKAISSIFFRLADDPNLHFFSMKNSFEMWFNYVPFCESKWNKLLVIPRNENGIWPWSEFTNSSSYSAYLKIVDNAVFISIEFCSEPGSIKNDLFANAKLTNVDNFDVNSKIVRLKVIKLPFENDEEIGKAVNLALDEFSRIGNILSNVNLKSEE